MAHTHPERHHVRWDGVSARRVDASGVALVLVAAGAAVLYFAAFPVTPFTLPLLIPAMFTAVYGLRHLTKRQVRFPRR